MPNSSLLKTLALVCLLAFQLTANASAEEQLARVQNIEVRLVDGTLLRGIADGHSDSKHLVLRFESPGAVLLRSIPWTDVSHAVVAGEKHTGPALRGKLANAVLTQAADPFEELLGGLVDMHGDPTPGLATLSSPSSPVRRAVNGLPANRVVSLQVKAQAVNWDADALVDGIEIVLRPVNAANEIISVNGSVKLQLMGQSIIPTANLRGANQPPQFPILAVETQRIRKSDFDASGVRLRLEYESLNPEVMHDIALFGRLDVRLAAAGHGVVEAHDSMVPLRPFSLIDDWRWQAR